MTRRALALAVAAIAIAVARPGAQQPGTPVFRGAVEAVELVVRVVDKDGRFVRDLKREDFRVLEDGREQKIDSFELIEIPIEPSKPLQRAVQFDADIAIDGVPIESDVTSNAGAAASRLYVMVLDDRDLGGSQDYRHRAVTTRAIAREFIEHHVGGTDRVAVMSTSGRTDLAQDFTSNRQVLLETVARFEAGFGQEPSGRGTVDPLMLAFRSVKELANWLAPIQGRRKTIVLITQNMGVFLEDTSLAGITDAIDEGNDLREMIVAANRANASIYILDPVGMPGYGPRTAIMPVFVNDYAEFDLGRSSGMEMLAEATGGFALTRSNDFIHAMDRIVTESSSYYVLSYSSSNTKRDGKLRRIKVDIRRPELTALTRTGYFVEKPRPAARVSSGLSPAMEKLIQSPLPVSGLPLEVSALALRGKSGKASVTVIVEAQGRSIQFTEQNGRHNGTLSFVMTAADQDAKVRASERTTLALRLSPSEYAAVVRDGVRLLTHVQLKSGRYQVKVAGLDTGNRNAQGIVLYDLTIPDFDGDALAMSGIAIGTKNASQVPTNAPDASWEKLLGMPPTTRRTFETTDELHLYAEVYARKNMDRVEVTTTVRRESGEVVFSRPQNAAPAPAPNMGARPVSAIVPLKDLAAGRYILSMRAGRSAEPDRPVTRQIPFEVRN